MLFRRLISRAIKSVNRIWKSLKGSAGWGVTRII
jgi:hypothetical protein